MKKHTQQFLWILLCRLVGRKKQIMLQLARIKATKAYLKGVQAARLTVLGYFGLCLLRILFAGGFFLFHAGLFFYLPWTLQDKGLLFLLLGGAYLLVVLLGVAVMGSQRLWMEMSQADELVEKALRDKPLGS